jgi:hypothetical protein
VSLGWVVGMSSTSRGIGGPFRNDWSQFIPPALAPPRSLRFGASAPSILALQRTRPAVDQHATFRLTKRTFLERLPSHTFMSLETPNGGYKSPLQSRIPEKAKRSKELGASRPLKNGNLLLICYRRKPLVSQGREPTFAVGCCTEGACCVRVTRRQPGNLPTIATGPSRGALPAAGLGLGEVEVRPVADGGRRPLAGLLSLTRLTALE